MNNNNSFWTVILLGWDALKQRINSKFFQWSAAAIVGLFIPLLFIYGFTASTFLFFAFLIWGIVLLERTFSDVSVQLEEFLTSGATRIPRDYTGRKRAVLEIKEKLNLINRRIHRYQNARERIQTVGAQIEADRRGQLDQIVDLEQKILTQLASSRSQIHSLTVDQKDRVQRLVDAAIRMSQERIACLNKIMESSEGEINREIAEAEQSLEDAKSATLQRNLTQLLESLREELQLYRGLAENLRTIESYLDIIESVLWRIFFEPSVDDQNITDELQVVDQIEGVMQAQRMVRELRA